MRIRILRMIVENFMNYVEKTFDFSDFTSISGRNGIGKSSIATAYNWCLFNCDYDLRDIVSLEIPIRMIISISSTMFRKR